jgi:hypothetical protein
MIRHIYAIFGTLVLLAILPINGEAGYMLNDAINGKENIKFNWTVKDQDQQGGFTYTYTVEGGQPLSGVIAPGVPFDWRNLRPDLDGKGAKFTFNAPAGATDWKQTIVDPNGSSTVFGGNITKDSPWTFHPLDQLPGTLTRIPDLAPVAGDPNATIYAAVNLPLYMASNPLGFLDGSWSPGQTLSQLGVNIVDGQVAGLQGIYWATTPFVFNSDPTGPGFSPAGGDSTLLNSSSYPDPIVILQQHTSVPEPSSLTLLGFGSLGLIGCAAWGRRKPIAARDRGPKRGGRCLLRSWRGRG